MLKQDFTLRFVVSAAQATFAVSLRFLTAESGKYRRYGDALPEGVEAVGTHAHIIVRGDRHLTGRLSDGKNPILPINGF